MPKQSIITYSVHLLNASPMQTNESSSLRAAMCGVQPNPLAHEKPFLRKSEIGRTDGYGPEFCHAIPLWSAASELPDWQPWKEPRDRGRTIPGTPQQQLCPTSSHQLTCTLCILAPSFKVRGWMLHMPPIPS